MPPKTANTRPGKEWSLRKPEFSRTSWKLGAEHFNSKSGPVALVYNDTMKTSREYDWLTRTLLVVVKGERHVSFAIHGYQREQ